MVSFRSEKQGSGPMKKSLYLGITFLILITVFVLGCLEYSVQASSTVSAYLTYPIDPQPFLSAPSEQELSYPIMPQPVPPEEPIKPPFYVDPSISTENIIGLTSFGEPVVLTPELISEVQSYLTPDGFIEVPAVFPNAYIQESSPNAIIGPDNREPVGDGNIFFPYTAIVYLEIKWADVDELQWCTGWMDGPSSVITAAHCIYDPTGHETTPTPAWIKAYPGYNYGSYYPEPFPYCEEFQRLVPYEWVYEGQSVEWDYGVYRLRCTIGDLTGQFGFKSFPDGIYNVELVGYPQDKFIGDYKTMWTSHGIINNLSPTLAYDNNDSVGGESGAPVWDTDHSTCQFCVMAVHSRGYDSESNIGPRLIGTYIKSFITNAQGSDIQKYSYRLL